MEIVSSTAKEPVILNQSRQRGLFARYRVGSKLRRVIG